MPEWLDKLRGKKDDHTGPASSQIKWATKATSQDGYSPEGNNSSGTFEAGQESYHQSNVRLLEDIQAGKWLPSYMQGQDLRGRLKDALKGQYEGEMLNTMADHYDRQVKIKR